MGLKKKLRSTEQTQRQIDAEITRRLEACKEKIKENLMKGWLEKERRRKE